MIKALLFCSALYLLGTPGWPISFLLFYVCFFVDFVED